MAGTTDIDMSSDQRKLELESAFVGAMDATDSYVTSYEQLHGRLKEVSSQAGNDQAVALERALEQTLLHIMQAFFELARARYAMGVHSISPAQFSPQLEASKRVRMGSHGAETSLLILEEDDQETLTLRRKSLSLNNKQSHDGKFPDAQGIPFLKHPRSGSAGQICGSELSMLLLCRVREDRSIYSKAPGCTEAVPRQGQPHSEPRGEVRHFTV